MPLARRVILHTPVSEEALLQSFVEQCLADKVVLLAIFGPECERIEDVVDWLVIGDGSQEEHFLCTTSHPGETLEDVLAFAASWELEGGQSIEHVHL